MKGKKLVIRAGDRYGRLVVINETGSRNGYRYIMCTCDCGNSFETKLTFLTTGQSRSCGCIKRGNVGQPTHGFSRSKLYKVWISMKQRCLNKRCSVFKHYGGRGIKLCSEWTEFEPFKAWAVSRGYNEGLTIDRIDNDKGYSPENCRWVTMAKQGINRRTNRIIEFNGRTQTLKEWAEEIGVDINTLRKRLINWPIERALTEKANESYSRRVIIAR